MLQSFPDEVSAAFGQFIRAHTTLSSRQMEFLNLLKNFIIEREKVEKRDLINAPLRSFTRKASVAYSARPKSTKSCS